MKKKIITFLLLVIMLCTMLVSCTGTTPDVAATENEITDLSQVNWTLPIEGASTTSYTLADAQKHELSKFITGVIVSDSNPEMGLARISLIIEGVLMKEMVADLGLEGASGATVEALDALKKPVTFELTAEDLTSDYCMIGWICNKKKPLPDTESYVGIFFLDDYKGEGDSCCSLNKIIFH